METRAAMRVGAMTVVGIALFIACWWFLSHGLYSWTHYRLNVSVANTFGLLRQSPVRMSGVVIGEVEDIQLTSDGHTPDITLAIENKYRGEIPDDSVIQITQGLLIQNPQIDIIPGHARSAYAPDAMWDPRHVMKPTSMLAQMSPEAENAVRQLDLTMSSVSSQMPHAMHKLLGILDRADATMTNLQQSTASLQRVAADPRIRRTLDASLADLQATTHLARMTAVSMSQDLKAIVKRNGTKIDQLADNAIDTLQKLGDTVDAARSAVTRLTEQVSDPRLQQSLLETLDMARATVARFSQIASDIHQLTGDPTIQTDLKATVANLRETVDEARPLMAKLNQLASVIRPGGKPRLGIGTPTIGIDFMARGNAPRFRSDVNLRVPLGADNAFDLGLYDFAETYRPNAQYETGLGKAADIRYGLYANKLGVGFDWRASPALGFVLDAFDPNRPQLNARGLIRLNPDFSLWVGADSLFRRTAPEIGLRLTR